METQRKADQNAMTAHGLKHIFPSVLACVAGGTSERVSFGGGAAILFPRGREEIKLASGEAASEIPTCLISYGFCLPPTFITIDYVN